MPSIAEQFEWRGSVEAGNQRRSWRLPNCPFAMWAFDRREGNILAANDAAVRLYGFPRERLLDATVDDVCRSALGSLLELALTTSPQTETVWHRRSDLSTFQTDVSMIECNGTGQTAIMLLVHPLLLTPEGDVRFTSALPQISANTGQQPGSFPSLAKTRA